MTAMSENLFSEVLALWQTGIDWVVSCWKMVQHDCIFSVFVSYCDIVVHNVI